MKRFFLFVIVAILALSQGACSLFQTGGRAQASQAPEAQDTQAPATPAATFTPLPPIPVSPGAAAPDEPVFITGDIPFTSPFFLDSTAEPFVMLEDQAGFAKRDLDFEFSRTEQVIGPVEISKDQKLTFSLALPTIPQGTQLDVDNNGQQDKGVQVFAVAYWSNTWGDPFLEPRDGRGWSNAYASTITDPERDYEISGGILVVWAPDEAQGFPTGFGADNKLFTDDDPSGPIPAGYNLVDLNQQPFRVYKEARPHLVLKEGATAVNDYSDLSYAEAFQKLIDKVNQEYPFTAEKNIDWQALRDQFVPRSQAVTSDEDFRRLLVDFAFQFPDGHVGAPFDQKLFAERYGGGYGLVLAELSDGKIVVTQVLPNGPADQAGIKPQAEIIEWNGLPVGQAIEKVVPGFGPYSTQHAQRAGQVAFLERAPQGTQAEVSFQNPDAQPANATLQAVAEYDSLFRSLPSFSQDPLGLPIQAQTLRGSGLGYIRIDTFEDDFNLMAQLWDRAIKDAIDNQVPGLVIDVRTNSGGSLGMALDFAGYFFDQEINLYQGMYYNENSGKFEANERPTRILPAPEQYKGPIAVLVSANCVSACEGFAYALQHDGRAIVVGHTPSAGAYGEVGQGQYKLPAKINMQFPTGRSETNDGKVVLEGVGVVPDITVPVTIESAMGTVDAVLESAVQALIKKIR